MKNEVEMNESQPRQTTRWTRRRMMCGLAAVAAAVYTEMRFVEPNWLGLGVHRVPLLPVGSERIRILQISDLHASDDMPLDFIEQAVELGLQQKPDVVCLTGDFITLRWDEWNSYSRILERLSKMAPTFGTTGNHDGGEWLIRQGGYNRPTKVIEMLEKANVQVLMNASCDVALPHKNPFELVGFGDLWSNDFVPGAFAKKRKNSKDRDVSQSRHKGLYRKVRLGFDAIRTYARRAVNAAMGQYTVCTRQGQTLCARAASMAESLAAHNERGRVDGEHAIELLP